MKIAMICMGNICRSPIAEHVLRTKAVEAGIEIEVASAGTGGWHAGDPADHRAAAVLREHGYSFNHRAQQINSDWFTKFDLLLVMDADNFRNVLSLAPDTDARSKVKLLRDFDPASPAGSEVPDPYYGGPQDFAQTLQLVEAAVDGLLAELFGVGR